MWAGRLREWPTRLLLLTMAVALAACTVRPAPPPPYTAPAPTLAPRATLTVRPPAIRSATATRSPTPPPSATASATPTPTTTPVSLQSAEQIAFVMKHGETTDLYLMGADGSEPTLLLAEVAGSPQWSPDGSAIAVFHRNLSDEWNLSVIHADGTGLRDVISERDYKVWFGPVWSPDGQGLLFSATVANTEQLFRAGADGSGVRQLTEAGGLEAAWSPDGSKIVFASIRDGGRALYMMNADGTDQVLLNAPIDCLEYGLHWSPDGRLIAYTAECDVDLKEELYIISPDGSGRRQLTEELGVWTDFSWSPDSRSIAFGSMSDNNHLFVVDVDSGAVTQLDAEEGAFFYPPQWSTDGQSLVFEAWIRPIRNFELYTLELASLTLRQLTSFESEGGAAWPSWRP